MMKVSSSTNGAIKLVFAICYNLLLLMNELQADSSSSSSAESSDEDNNILTVVPRTWDNQYSTEYYDMPGGTAKEEPESESENESRQADGNSVNVDGASIPNTDTQTGQSSTVSVSIASSENVTPYRTTSMRTNVHVGGNNDVDDDDGDDTIDNDEDEEENETDNENDGGGGGTVPVTVPVTTMSTGGGKRTFFPVLPLSGRHCFVLENQQLCQCNSQPPLLPIFPENLRIQVLSKPDQIKSSTRQHGDCDILCICWILAFVGVVIGAVCKVSKNRRTHF